MFQCNKVNSLASSGSWQNIYIYCLVLNPILGIVDRNESLPICLSFDLMNFNSG